MEYPIINNNNEGEFRSQKEDTKYQEAKKIVVRLLRKHHFTYDETKYLFKLVRKDLELKPQKKKQTVARHLSQEESERLIEYAYRQRSDYGLLIKSLLFTGTRINEFVNIKVEDCLFSDNKILIREGKGNKERYVPIFPFLKQELITHIYNRKAGYLFESRLNNQFSSRRIQQILKEVAKKAGIARNIYPHLLRHTVATFLLNRGITLDQVQLFLGHADIRTTQIYAKTSIEKLGLDYNKVVGGLLPKTYGASKDDSNNN